MPVHTVLAVYALLMTVVMPRMDNKARPAQTQDTIVAVWYKASPGPPDARCDDAHESANSPMLVTPSWQLMSSQNSPRGAGASSVAETYHEL